MLTEGGALSFVETFAVSEALEISLFVVQRFLVRQPVWCFPNFEETFSASRHLNFEETFSASKHLNFEETFSVLTNLGTF